MTILRFARNKSYGWYSSLGMFIGHFAAWIAAGIMGAGAAYIMKTPLAFQSLNQKWSRERVTLVVGMITAVIACSPFVFSQLLGFLGIMAVIMAPVGAIIFAEHYLFKRLGLTQYWRAGRGDSLNMPAAITWAATALFAWCLGSAFGIHIFFLFIPTWIAAVILYPLLSSAIWASKLWAKPRQTVLRPRSFGRHSYILSQQQLWC